MSLRHGVVLAGGLGTRAKDLTFGLIPKTLLEVSGRPFLAWKIDSLIEMGFKSASILVGELGIQVEEFIHQNSFAIDIEIIYDGDALLGTAGSIRRVLDDLPSKFWVTFGDSYVKTDLDEAEKYAADVNCSRVMTVLRNRDQLQVSNTSIHGGLVTSYEKKAGEGIHQWIDYGLLLVENSDFQHLPMNVPSDLSDVIQPLINSGQLCAFEVSERFWDVGDPKGFQETIEYFETK